MNDIGNDETEKLLKKLERKISREYSQAATETRKKFLDYMRRFRIKDDIKRQAWLDGKITQAEYVAWRKQQIMVGKHWAELVDDLAKDLHNANDLAVSTAKGYLPEVYAINHNWAAYLLETTSDVGLSFELYSRETVERLIRDVPKLLPDPRPGSETALKLLANKDLRWNREKIVSAVTQGILQGESIPKLTKRLESVATMNHKAAIRNARTMVTSAQNAGRLDAAAYAKSQGVETVNVWAATMDMRTRHAHRLLDGQRRELGKPFYVEGEEIMFPGDPEAAAHLVYNCRCTLIPQVKGFEYNIHSSKTDFSHIDGMTYNQWKHNRTERTNPITLPEEKAAAMRWKYINEYRKLRKKDGG